MSTTQIIILLVDDDPNFLEIFGSKLRAAGFDVQTAGGGKEVFKKLESLTPDLIVLDVQMPDMSGVEVLKKLKKDPKTAKIKTIFLTNAGTNQEDQAWLDQKFAKEFGALDHIRKSDDLEAITGRIKAIIQGE